MSAPLPISTVESTERTERVYLVTLKYDAKRAGKRIMNRMAAAYSKSEWMHCELYFPRTRESVTIDCRNPVYVVKDKDYTSREWYWNKIMTTPQEYNRIYRYCMDQVGSPFDLCGIWFFWCPLGMLSTSGKWICSRLCASALQTIGIFPAEVSADDATPGTLKAHVDALSLQYSTSPNPRVENMDKTLPPEITGADSTVAFVTDKRSMFTDDKESPIEASIRTGQEEDLEYYRNTPL